MMTTVYNMYNWFYNNKKNEHSTSIFVNAMNLGHLRHVDEC